MMQIKKERQDKWKLLTQKPVLIMKNSIEAPIIAEPTAIFKYQSRNFICNRINNMGHRPISENSSKSLS